MMPEGWWVLAQVGSGTPPWMEGPRALVAAGVYALLMLAGVAVNIGLFIRYAQKPEGYGWVPLATRPWKGLSLLRIASLLLLLQVLVMGFHRVLECFGLPPPAPDEVYWIVAQSLIMHVAGTALVGAMLVRERLSWGGLFGSLRQWRSDIGKGALYYLAALPFVWLVSALFVQLLRLCGYQPDMQETALMLSADASWPVRLYLIGLAVVLAPLFEEIVFRGALLPLLMRRLPPIASVAVVSLLFASIHMHPSSMAALFTIAFAFGLAYLRTGRLLVPITMHALFNAVNLSMLLFMR